MRTHLNTAGAGLMSRRTVETMIEVLEAEQRDGAYETEQRYDDELNVALYKELGRLVNADPQDVAIFDSATRAWSATFGRLALRSGQRVIITPYEYAGNLMSLTTLQKRYGFRIEVMPLDGAGDLDLDWLRRSVDDDVALVSVPHVPSGCGIVNPVEEIGRILDGGDALYVVDGCQSVGQLPVDVGRIGCDLFTGAGRKFLCGPRGTGFAVASRRLRERLTPDLLDLHVADIDQHLDVAEHVSGARGLELAERSTAVFMGLLASLAEAPDPAGLDNGHLSTALAAELRTVDGVQVFDPGRRQSGITAFRHDRVPAARIAEELRAAGVNVWKIAGSHTPLYLLERDVTTAVRVSVHWYTTEADLTRFMNELRRILA
ncbi:aminotransferase class V-fold PLP-dependent enzyme [Nonomuraea typhae]|uniref:Aminotransferase class V-fold PLP-dependent enzyme n=1 Tax=Nonomuraea typhae TaxID=2603600 RepID=A0ABW7ZAI1_9ACTN